MRVFLEQVNTIDLGDLRRQVAVLSNREKIIDADVNENKARVYRFGTVSVRWSHLSEKWILQDGVAIEGTYNTAKDAVKRAKKVSGYEEETQSQIIRVEPVPMDFDGTVPLDLVQNFQPTPVSSYSSGSSSGGGGGPVSLNVPSIGGDVGIGGLPSLPPGGPGSDSPTPEAPTPSDIGA
jgi:hypothetical protein